MKPYVTTIAISIAVISIIANILLFLKYSTSRPLVSLGPDVVTKKEYQDAVDYSYGAPTLKRLVFAKLVQRAASRDHITPTDADIDTRIAEIRRRSPSMLPDPSDETAVAQFRKDVSNQLAIENLRIQGVNATEPEIQSYYNAHKADFKVPAQVATTIVVCRNPVEAQTAETELKQNFTPDAIARNGLAVVGVNGFQINMQALPKDQQARIQQSVLHLPAGSVETLPADKYFVVIKVNHNDPEHTPDLTSIHDEVARLVKLEKGPSQTDELATLYNRAHPSFTVDKYRAYFADMGQENGRRVAQAQ